MIAEPSRGIWLPNMGTGTTFYGKIFPMKRTVQTLDPKYLRLRQRLARLGYISQGSVLDRSTLKPPRSGFSGHAKWRVKPSQSH